MLGKPEVKEEIIYVRVVIAPVMALQRKINTPNSEPNQDRLLLSEFSIQDCITNIPCKALTYKKKNQGST